MTYKETKLEGAYVIKLDPVKDKRGYFARSFCQKELKKQGINFKIKQCNRSFNKKRGTLRGMHYQVSPYREAKTVTCLSGAIFDVIVDLRKRSKTFGRWIAVKLTARNQKMLYIPGGFAHGFQALEDNTLVSYQMGGFYNPGAARGIRWDDQFLNIKWPVKKIIISKRDVAYNDF